MPFQSANGVFVAAPTPAAIVQQIAIQSDVKPHCQEQRCPPEIARVHLDDIIYLFTHTHTHTHTHSCMMIQPQPVLMGKMHTKREEKRDGPRPMNS